MLALTLMANRRHPLPIRGAYINEYSSSGRPGGPIPAEFGRTTSAGRRADRLWPQETSR